MKDHIRICILVLCVLTLAMTACGGSTPAATEAQSQESKETLPDKPETTAEVQTTKAAETATKAAAETTTEAVETTTEAASEPAGRDVMLYEVIRGEYFQHGGDWTTMLYVNEDGSFTGEFSAHYFQNDRHHYDVGEFHGTFAEAKQIDELTWTIRVESVTVDGEIGEEWEEDGETYTRIGDPTAPIPGTELTVWLPGSDSTQIPEEFFMWIRASAEVMPKLEGTALVNDTEGVLSFYYRLPAEG